MEETNNIEDIEQIQDVKQQQKVQKRKPRRILPSDRIAFDKQINLLRAFAVNSGIDRKPVDNQNISDTAQIHPVTISTANPFFSDVGFITKMKGGYVPCDEVFAFQHAIEWNEENPGSYLAPILRKTWFSDSLLPKLSLGSLPEERALQILAQEADVDKEYKSTLVMIISYLEYANIIKRENDSISLIKQNVITKIPDTPNIDPTSKEKLAAKINPQDSPAGGLSFSVNIKVSMNELAGWSPERISKFFEGLAKVISAKSELDKNEKLTLDKEV